MDLVNQSKTIIIYETERERGVYIGEEDWRIVYMKYLGNVISDVVSSKVIEAVGKVRGA